MNFKVEYEDNHLIIVNKRAGLLSQGDQTQDLSLLDEVKTYIKEKYKKPGKVYLGLVHRLDRPTSGLVVLAKTSKALSRMNTLFVNREVKKNYIALVEGQVNENEAILEDFLVRNPKQNKSYAYSKELKNSKLAKLKFTKIQTLDRYTLLRIELFTGRHHQIRCQLSHRGYSIKGDLKYGAKRPNRDKSIGLHAHYIDFIHPVSKLHIQIQAAPFSDTENIWSACEVN
ncbi:MAG: RluA family pseudouridine synthase [Flavobacteriales bacterium]